MRGAWVQLCGCVCFLPFFFISLTVGAYVIQPNGSFFLEIIFSVNISHSEMNEQTKLALIPPRPGPLKCSWENLFPLLNVYLGYFETRDARSVYTILYIYIYLFHLNSEEKIWFLCCCCCIFFCFVFDSFIKYYLFILRRYYRYI